MGDSGGGHWLVRMEWHPSRWSVYLPLLIFPCTIKSRSSLLAPGWSLKKGRKMVVVKQRVVVSVHSYRAAKLKGFIYSIRNPVLNVAIYYGHPA